MCRCHDGRCHGAAKRRDVGCWVRASSGGGFEKAKDAPILVLALRVMPCSATPPHNPLNPVPLFTLAFTFFALNSPPSSNIPAPSSLSIRLYRRRNQCCCEALFVNSPVKKVGVLQFAVPANFCPFYTQWVNANEKSVSAKRSKKQSNFPHCRCQPMKHLPRSNARFASISSRKCSRMMLP